ncbi:MAG TPA: hypothetical protein VNN79_16840 [Actinomycetota bacterium]|nr:hypothetical protein [Actinomycetota bacterium]
MSTKPDNGDITNWGVVYWPRIKDYVIVGEWKASRDEGNFIRTSPIMILNLAEKLVETRNSIYHLVGPSDHEAAQAAFSARYFNL